MHSDKRLSNKDLLDKVSQIPPEKVTKLKELYKRKDPTDQGISKADLFTLFKGNNLTLMTHLPSPKPQPLTIPN